MTGTGRQRLTQQRLAEAAAAAEPIAAFGVATVAVVTPGAAKAGAALVTVDYLGARLPATYDPAYTPTTGDRVLVADAGGLLTIVGRRVGFPPNTGGS